MSGIPSVFADRREAGVRLGEELLSRGLGHEECVVLAIPRGGVVVGAEVARALEAPLDVVIPRKVGAPGNPELGLGAIAPGVRVLDQRLLRDLGVTKEYLDAEIDAQEREIERRSRAYRVGRAPVQVAGRTAIVVDDGVATGGTAVASCRWARAAGATRVVLAVPVAPAQSLPMLRAEADDVVVLEVPDPSRRFYAVGQWYDRFDQTEDDEVIRALSGGPT